MRRIIFSLLVIASSCIEAYKPDISKYEDVFVVDGKLTNLPGPYTVKLSRSFEFEESLGLPVVGAQVKIIDNSGREIGFKETSKGVYVTTDGSFQGVVGNSYKLQIKLDGETYESEFEKLKEPVPIDSVYWKYEKLQNGKDGIQLLLDTHDSKNVNRYYGWDFVETWKFSVPSVYPKRPDWRECYKNAGNQQFNIATTIHRKDDVLEGRAIQFIDEGTNKLYLRYSMLVTQLSLTEQAYKYFEDLVSVNQNQGTLFDPTPSSLVGNMKNIRDKDLPVLGYFLVAGASEKRIFIDRKELPKEYQPSSGFEDCNQAYVVVNAKFRNNIRFDRSVDSLMRRGYSVIIQEDEVRGSDTLMHLFLAKAPCYNCTLNGTNKLPDFWKEN